MFRDRVVNLTSPEALEQFLDKYPTSVLFKAGTCHKTMQGFGFLQEKLEPRDDLMVGIIRVVEARPASNLVSSEMTGIRHESPQVILFKDGEAVYDLDNWDINPQTLDAGFAQVPPADGASVSKRSRPTAATSSRIWTCSSSTWQASSATSSSSTFTRRCSATTLHCAAAKRSKFSTRFSAT